MKKLLLLIAASSIGMSLSAQESKSIVFLQSSKMEIPHLAQNVVTSPVKSADLMKRSAEARQKTSTIKPNNHNTWFYYWSQNEISSSTLYYYATAADSNILDNAGTGTPYNIYCHGLGMSFDPTDNGYYGGAATTAITETPITDLVPYQIDSFYVPFQYIRHNNTTTAADSLIVEFAVTTLFGDSGTYKLRFNASAANLAITPDSTPRFASANYTRVISGLGPNTMWDSILGPKQRYAFPLVLADTTGGGPNAYFALSTPLNVPARGKVVSFVHFKSAFTTTLGTSTAANSNYIKLYSGTTAATSGTWPTQTPHSTGYQGSYQTGIIAQDQIRYADTGFTYMGHNILIPGVAFSSPGLAVTNQAFHVKWTTMDEDGVTNINQTIKATKAFPNPANNEVSVSFNMNSASNVTVTLTNTVGQEVSTQSIANTAAGVATFNTTTLPAGIYFYTVNANGERSTGRVVVSH